MCYPSRETSLDEFLQEMVELLNGKDGSDKSMDDDPDWLEIVGHPTIPHVQSLREAPAHVALQPHSERLIGLEHRNAAKRYLEKLKKERERNQEVLTECVDNLPIVIRQVAYPGKNTSARSFPGRVADHSRKELYQENAQERAKEKRLDAKAKTTPKTQRKLPKTSQNQSSARKNAPALIMQSSGTSETDGFVPHSVFPGIHERQVNNLRYKFGKKKAGSDTEVPQPFVAFNPKGYGCLHDELELERRNKKAFDGNKHTNLANSNFINGQKISKRKTLPPIGHTQTSSKSNCVGHNNAFAIMSVQRFNYPKEVHVPTAESNDHSHSFNHTVSTFIDSAKDSIEMTESLGVPATFLSGSIGSTTSTSFHGAKCQSKTTSLRETTNTQSLNSQQSDSAFGTLTEDTNHPLSRENVDLCHSAESNNSKKRNADHDTILGLQNI